jgi:N4-gp56 family major capsid protein
MADALTSTSTLDNLLPVYFVKRALPRLVARAVLYQNADKTPLPKGEGKTVTWNAWSNFSPVSASLSEGTNPSLAAVSSRKVTASISQYGRGVKTSDLVEYTASLDVINGVVDNLADSASLSLDKVVQLAIFKSTLRANNGNAILSAWMSCRASGFFAGSNGSASTLTWGFPVMFGTTATRLSAVSNTAPSVSARMSLYAVKKVVKTLRSNNAMEFADGYFKLITNTDAVADLRTDPDYKNWLNPTDPSSMKAGDANSPVEGCRVIQSNNMPKYRATAHNCDVSFIFGQGAYGVVDVASGGGRGFEIIIKRPGQSDTSNPLNMYATLSYKFTMAAAALNVSCGRVLVTHSKP